ncbi:MAG: PIG-L family deacetylase [Deltaproteobacteria bacterium]|jgi:LmbE family N-acetylglucosaminyl deacetylase|nr:PIG-L family deacetylase [Deltaproteobacteria bacterium]
MTKSRIGRLATLLATALGLGCAGAHVPEATQPSIEEVLRADARVMWISAHPDDEALAGSVLTHACVGLKTPCYFLVFNHGDGGECLLPEGCHPDLGTVRGHELEESAALYGATLEHYRLYNAPLPVESFPAREVIAAKWKDAIDPSAAVALAIRRFQPTVVLTLDAYHGFTCHPEHQLAARFAMEGIRRAAEPREAFDGAAPWRTPSYFEVLNRYWFLAPLMGRDPEPYTDVLDPDQNCSPTETCIDMAGRFSHAHRTQAGDMGSLRTLSHLIYSVYLRRMDPWVQVLDPLEPARNTCG